MELGAPLFTENDTRQTPCELAEKASMISIAQYLESKMVFCVSILICLRFAVLLFFFIFL